MQRMCDVSKLKFDEKFEFSRMCAEWKIQHFIEEWKKPELS